MEYDFTLEGSRAKKRKISRDCCFGSSMMVSSQPPLVGTHLSSPLPLPPPPPTSMVSTPNPSFHESNFHGPRHFNKPPSPITPSSPLKPCFQQFHHRVLMSSSFDQFPTTPTSLHPSTTTEQQLQRVIELQQQQIDELKKLLQEREEAWQNQIQERVQHQGVVKALQGRIGFLQTQERKYSKAIASFRT